ncbi:hypothetical protein, partial [Empedobacter sp.]|uniref:hypothetical protein n=1 Tax=Empedobacter sp. TaxID=1927715 RepID=UPI0028AF5903
DDYIVKEAYEKMYSCAIENDADIVECQTLRDGIIIESQYSGKWDSRKVLYDYFELGNLPTMLWMRIYKRKLFEKPVFPNAYTNNEDNFALPCLLYNANKIYFLKEQLHYYSSDNEHAVMENINRKTVDNSKIIINRTMTLKAISHIRDYIGKNVIEKEYYNVFKSHISRIVLSFCLYDFESLPISKRIEIVCTNLNILENDLNAYYKNYYRDNEKVKFLITLIGLRNTVFIYNNAKKFRR